MEGGASSDDQRVLLCVALSTLCTGTWRTVTFHISHRSYHSLFRWGFSTHTAIHIQVRAPDLCFLFVVVFLGLTVFFFSLSRLLFIVPFPSVFLVSIALVLRVMVSPFSLTLPVSSCSYFRVFQWWTKISDSEAQFPTDIAFFFFFSPFPFRFVREKTNAHVPPFFPLDASAFVVHMKKKESLFDVSLCWPSFPLVIHTRGYFSYTHTPTHPHTHTYVHTYVCLSVYICMYMCVGVCVCVCAYACLFLMLMQSYADIHRDTRFLSNVLGFSTELLNEI